MEKKAAAGMMLILLLIGLFTMAFKTQAAKAMPETIRVPTDYPTIQAAINAANPGDTIFVYNGTYYENVVVNKTVLLVGENPNNTIIDGGGSGAVVYVTSSNVSVSGFTIRNSSSTSPKGGIRLEPLFYNITISGNNIMNNSVGIYLDKTLDNTIRGNNITNNGIGIRSGVSSYSIVSGNIIANNSDYGLYLFGSFSHTIIGNALVNNSVGIYLKFQGINIIRGNNISSDSGKGIYLSGSDSNTIDGNNITSNGGYGLYLSGSHSNTVIGNVVTKDTMYGIFLDSSSDNNVIAGNNIPSSNSVGIYLRSSGGNVVSANNVSKGLYGIGLDYSGGNIISGNNITKNSKGIDLYLSSYNIVYHNNFVNNTDAQADSQGSSNIWDDNYPSGGNFWSDYEVVDLFSGPYQNETGSDGLGDTPYNITDPVSGTQEDKYPLADQYVAIHDIAVTSVTLSEIVESLMYIYVTVENQGDYPESFKVTVYINPLLLKIVRVTNLAPLGMERTLIVPWNVTEVALGNYTIRAVAEAVLGETDTANNEKSVTFQLSHDIAVKNVTSSKTVVGTLVHLVEPPLINITLRINVTVQNQGYFTETFNVTLYADTNTTQIGDEIHIGTETIENSTRGASTILMFNWTTTTVLKGNYTLSAYVTPVSGETDTADNNFTDGWVIVAMVGDVSGLDGWPDGKVNIADLTAIARHFGTQPDKTPPDKLPYHPNYDLNDDLKINIADITRAARYFGETDP